MHFKTQSSNYNIEKFSLFFVLVKEQFAKLIVIGNGAGAGLEHIASSGFHVQ